jgi:hypothetical protein
MRYVLDCRRTFIAIFAINCLFLLGLVKGQDVATSIAAVAMGLAAANAGERALKKRQEAPNAE